MNKQKNVLLVLGSEGYIGYSLCSFVHKEGYKVVGVDNFSREKNVKSVGSKSLVNIKDRKRPWKFFDADITSYDKLYSIMKYYSPDTIVHLAEQPSAPFSMIDVSHATYTQQNNIIGTLNILWAIKNIGKDIHLVKLGTMGEWSDWIYQNTPIPESHRVVVKYNNEDIEIPSPKYTGSFYHWSKIHDTNNIDFANRIWGISCTDIMQGVVYGVNTSVLKDGYATRYDYDECFGTVINRFVVQAILGLPLTVYGLGKQTRGYLPLKDSIQCLHLIIQNRPKNKEYRLINQIENLYSVNQLAELVTEVAAELGITANISSVKNPRIEKEEHAYVVSHDALLKLGYIPTTDIKSEIKHMFETLMPLKRRIKKDVILPKTQWK